MNVIRRFAGWAGVKMAAAGGISFSTQDINLSQLLGAASITGRTVNESTMMRISTAFACVRVIAETVGSVTLDVFEKQRSGNSKKVDHDLGVVLIDSPNANMTGMEFREASTTNLAARGNAYAIIERNVTGNVSSLYPVPAANCQPRQNKDTGLLEYVVNDRGRSVPYPAEKIWHWKGFGFSGLEGLSPIGQAREAFGLALAGEEAQARMFANGLTSSAVVSIPEWLEPNQREQAKKILAEKYEGLKNFGKPFLLEGGMKLEQGIFAPRDAQFLELRQMQVTEICRLFRIPPHMVADLQRATNNNIEQLSLEFLMYSMLPYFRRIEESARKLFKPADRTRFYIRFNRESLLRADSIARAQLYSILLQNGAVSRNEVRALENMPNVAASGMDDYTVQSNMTLVNLLEQMVRAQTAGGAK